MSKKTTDETLGREAVKEYLQQYHTAVGKKRILEERHRVLSSELRAPSTGSAFRLTPPIKPTKTDGSVSVVFRISEVEDRIEEQREEMAKAVLNVMDLIDVLPANSTERTVVEMRHIDCRGWDKIAEALYMSRSNVFNYYNAALDKILENKRNRKLLGFVVREKGGDRIAQPFDGAGEDVRTGGFGGFLAHALSPPHFTRLRISRHAARHSLPAARCPPP